ncbi:GntR family transcriptional regulator [Actinacidiphila glaucinigra]|uniref:GntR family transcriptional regulator n=1 Tax=Actinacidiphila glaucinigra TaxID=235986 RepID=A0A239M276_9ACTN|nr:GntR family transcriptional regulator [Actinacidiphila glaucinigra]SNT36183.1 GntR family transcriptional regulator [Actinacidiphila glaucinigra]
MTGEAPRSPLKRERVRDHLLELVESQAPGTPIPSERALCEQLDVSRPTVRSAVDELVTTGLLVRRHGSGMFVAPAKITQELAQGENAFSLPQASGHWLSRVLEFATVRAGARVGRKLRVSPAAEIVYIARLRLVDGEPMAVEYLHVPAELVPGLRAADMESGDFYACLRERHGVLVHEAVQSIEPTVANEEEARLLQVPVLSPALLFDRLTSDAAGRPVEYVHSLYRGDRYRIVSRLSLADSTSAGLPVTAGHHPGMPPDERAAPAGTLAHVVGDVQPRG